MATRSSVLSTLPVAGQEGPGPPPPGAGGGRLAWFHLEDFPISRFKFPVVGGVFLQVGLGSRLQAPV